MRSPSPSPRRSPSYFQKTHLDSSEYHGIIWSILFLINLAATFFVCYYIIDKTVGFKIIFKMFSSNSTSYNYLKEFDPNFTNEDFFITMTCVKKSIKIAIAATFIANVIHFVYAFSLPKTYIRLHMLLSLFYCFIPAILLFIPQTSFIRNNHSFWGIAISLVSAALGIFLFFYLQRFVSTSAELMKTSTRILGKNPSLFLVNIIQSIIILAINIIYLLCITAIKEYSSTVTFHPLIILYGVFTYYWIIMTIYYTCYMTTAGVVGYECYLGRSKHTPQFLVLSSFKRAITHHLGSAAYTGFILAITQTLKFLVELFNPKNIKRKRKGNRSDNDNNNILTIVLYIVLSIVYYILNFILSIFESYIDCISRQALIYCAVFGCSYKEGCRRYHKSGFSDKIKKYYHESIISGATGTNYTLFMIFAGLAVYYFQSTVNNSELKTVFISVLFTEILMIAFSFTSSLITSTCDTIFLCLLENPAELNRNHRNLYSKLKNIKVY